MKYIFFCPSGAFGGLEMQMVRRAHDAITRGDEAILVAASGSAMADYAASLDVPFVTIPIKFDYIDLPAAIRLGRLMKSECADSCIVGITRHLSIAIAAKKLFRLDSTIVLFQQMISGLKKIDFFHNWVYRNLDTAIVPTELMSCLLQESTIFPKEKIEIIPYGIDVEEVNPARYNIREEKDRFGLPQNKFIIGHTARFEPLKDQETAIRAFAAAKIEGAHLVLAGEGDPQYKESMKTLANTLGIADSIAFLNFTHRFGALVNCFDVYVMTSLCETFSLALLQAMAAGKPVIGTKSGGTPEAIAHEVNGLLFEPRDTETLAKYFRRLYADDAFRERLARQARRDSYRRYDSRTVNEKFFAACTKQPVENIEIPLSIETGKLKPLAS